METLRSLQYFEELNAKHNIDICRTFTGYHEDDFEILKLLGMKSDFDETSYQTFVLASLYSLGYNYPTTFFTNSQVKKRIGDILSILLEYKFHGVKISSEIIQSTIGFTYEWKSHRSEPLWKNTSSLFYDCYKTIISKHEQSRVIEFHRILHFITLMIYSIVELTILTENKSFLLNIFEKNLKKSLYLKAYTYDDVFMLSNHGSYEDFNGFIDDLTESITRKERNEISYSSRFSAYLQLFYGFYNIQTPYNYIEIYNGSIGCGLNCVTEYVPYLFPVYTTHSEKDDIVNLVYLVPFLVVSYESMSEMMSILFRKNNRNRRKIIEVGDFIITKK